MALRVYYVAVRKMGSDEVEFFDRVIAKPGESVESLRRRTADKHRPRQLGEHYHAHEYRCRFAEF
jgi:hypothetical protein